MPISVPELSPQLLQRTGPHVGRVYELPLGVHIIGRGPEVSVQLEHPDISRRHARLDVGATDVVLEDLGSKNGVFVDGERVSQPRRLRHGQVLNLGDVALELHHPAGQVAKALADAGETTVTRLRDPEPAAPRPPSLLLPLIGVAVFGILVTLMLLL